MNFNDRRPFYHGTDVNLGVGDKITPPRKRGTTDRYGSDDYDFAPKGRKVADWSFASQNEDIAWKYAHSAARGNTNGNSSFSDTKKGTETGRSRVYRVEPAAEPVRGPEFYSRGHDEHVAKEWKVTGQIDSQPGRQSAIPGINWNKHRKNSATGDANHPNIRTETLSSSVELPALASHGQLDLFNNRTAKEQARRSSKATDVEKYHANTLGGRRETFETKRVI